MNDPHRPAQAPGASPHAPQPVRPIGQPMQQQQPRPVIAPGQPAQRPVVQPRPAQAVPHAPAAAPARMPMQPSVAAPARMPMAPTVATPQDDSPISLVEDEIEELVEEAAPATTTTTHNKIVFGPDIVHRKHDWKRKVNATGAGACRVKTFHGKLSDQGMEYLDDAINVWLDANPDIEVKFVTSTVGMYEGKFKDLALILNVWY